MGLAGEEWSNIWLAHGGCQEVEEPDIMLKICCNLQLTSLQLLPIPHIQRLFTFVFFSFHAVYSHFVIEMKQQIIRVDKTQGFGVELQVSQIRQDRDKTHNSKGIVGRAGL